MSKLIPLHTVDALRDNVDVVLDMYGIDCNLLIPTPTSFLEAEKLDAYMTPGDLSYVLYTAKVFIDVQPDIKRLRKLGLYTEGSLPIVAKFGRRAVAVSGPVEDSGDVHHGVGHYCVRYVPEYGALLVTKRHHPHPHPYTLVDIVQGSWFRISIQHLSGHSDVSDFEVIDIIPPEFHDAIIWQECLIAPRRVKE